MALYPSTPARGTLIPMALNIKNERTVALARELAELNGTSITSAIEDALEARLAQARASEVHVNKVAQERLARSRELLAELDASMTDQDRANLVAAQHEMYDEYGLPR